MAEGQRYLVIGSLVSRTTYPAIDLSLLILSRKAKDELFTTTGYNIQIKIYCKAFDLCNFYMHSKQKKKKNYITALTCFLNQEIVTSKYDYVLIPLLVILLTEYFTIAQGQVYTRKLHIHTSWRYSREIYAWNSPILQELHASILYKQFSSYTNARNGQLRLQMKISESCSDSKEAWTINDDVMNNEAMTKNSHNYN